MKNIENLEADYLLKIPLNQPELLFTRDLDVARKEFHALVFKWHTDHNPAPKAGEVFNHINLLYHEAEKRLTSNTWQVPGLLKLASKTEKYGVRYFKKEDFELGAFYVGENHVTYVLKPEFEDLWHNALSAIHHFKYLDADMKKEMSRSLPTVKDEFKSLDGSLVLIVDKPADYIMLSDLVHHLDGKLDPKHVAWSLSRLYGITCYLELTKRTHNGISDKTFFVNPDAHWGLLLGGWWYAREKGDRLLALPSEAVNAVPSDIMASKKADPRIDLNLIKILGQELLGNTSLKALKTFLAIASSGSAMRDFESWHKALESTFGARKFTPLNVNWKEVYKDMLVDSTLAN